MSKTRREESADYSGCKMLSWYHFKVFHRICRQEENGTQLIQPQTPHRGCATQTGIHSHN